MANFECLSLTAKEQSAGKSTQVCLYIQYQYLEKFKRGGGYLRLQLHVRVVVDYADTRFSSFVIEYLRENSEVS